MNTNNSCYHIFFQNLLEIKEKFIGVFFRIHNVFAEAFTIQSLQTIFFDLWRCIVS